MTFRLWGGFFRTFSGRFDTSGSMKPRLVPQISPLDAFCDVVVAAGIGDSRSWIICWPQFSLIFPQKYLINFLIHFLLTGCSKLGRLTITEKILARTTFDDKAFLSLSLPLI